MVWEGEWVTMVNSLNSALDGLERDRIGGSADDHIARSDERTAAVRTYSLAPNRYFFQLNPTAPPQRGHRPAHLGHEQRARSSSRMAGALTLHA